METKQLDFLVAEINNRIDSFSKSKNKYKKEAFYSYFGISILSAISTIILGIQVGSGSIFGFSMNEITRTIALVISSLISVISVFNSFFDHKELWGQRHILGERTTIFL